ncbi:MAG: hypothetical protein AAF394_14415, partial [Planctomycetota bacterium]
MLADWLRDFCSWEDLWARGEDNSRNSLRVSELLLEGDRWDCAFTWADCVLLSLRDRLALALEADNWGAGSLRGTSICCGLFVWSEFC